MRWEYGYLFMKIADFKKVSSTTSIMKDISKTARLTYKNVQLLLMCGSRSALPRFELSLYFDMI